MYWNERQVFTTPANVTYSHYPANRSSSTYTHLAPFDVPFLWVRLASSPVGFLAACLCVAATSGRDTVGKVTTWLVEEANSFSETAWIPFSARLMARFSASLST